MSQPRRPFTPSPAYRLFLKSLVQTREDRGYSVEQLAEFIGLTPAQVAAFESGATPLTFIDVRNWLLALDMPFTQFTQQMEEVLDTTLTTDEGIAYPNDNDPEDIEPNPERYARAAPLVPAPTPTIQVLFFPPGEAHSKLGASAYKTALLAAHISERLTIKRLRACLHSEKCGPKTAN